MSLVSVFYLVILLLMLGEQLRKQDFTWGGLWAAVFWPVLLVCWAWARYSDRDQDMMERQGHVMEYLEFRGRCQVSELVAQMHREYGALASFRLPNDLHQLVESGTIGRRGREVWLIGHEDERDRAVHGNPGSVH